MKAWLVTLLVATSALAQTARLCPSTQLSEERILLSTSVGDIGIALYPEVAPRHRAQILQLVRAGVYEGTAFIRVIPGFAAQLGGVARRGPLTGEQVKLITSLKAEFNACPHRRGTISMAHDPQNPDSAQTSFLIMFGEIPQMNGRFTVVGEVVGGEDVLDALERTAVNPVDNAPLKKTELKTARLLSASEAARAQASLEARPEDAETLPAGFSFVCLVTTALGLCLVAFCWRRPAQVVARALGMLFLLTGGFGLFAWAVPQASRLPGLGIFIFVACIGVFKILSQFELG